METIIRGGFPHYVPPGTPAARGLDKPFLLSKKGSSSPFTLCMCIARIRLVIHVNNE
jgi:hypothetical protein